jgi:RHS repeat-associated protein
MLVACAAVLAQQAMDPDESLLEMMTPDAMQMGTMSAMSSSFATVPDQTPVSLAAQLPAHNPAVGKLPGEADTSGGAASYSIPIIVPPGRRGVQPDLSLDYSSRSGNGIAGMGWSLSGFSAIGRCQATLDQDGAVRAVRLDASDKLCLDGQRLVVTTGTYGQSGAVYATELETFARVSQLGGALNSATTYFKVETKSGDIFYYGGTSTATSTSRVIPGSATIPMTWMVDRQQDRVGNLMRYVYASYGNGETVLSSILYTGFGTTDGTRHVDFTYQARLSTGGANDVASSYMAGAVILQTQRLAQITTYVGTQAVRWYVLRYDAASAHSGRSLLRGIKECAYRTDGATVACHGETTFVWQEGTVNSDLHALTLAGLPTNQPFSYMRPLGDIDGDGVQEMVVHYSDPIHHSLGTNYLVSLNADRSIKGVVPAAALGGAFALNPSFGNAVDINKDGRTDIYSWKTVGSSQYLSVTVWNNSTAVWGASAFTTYDLPISVSNVAATPLLGDVSGDGFVDLVLMVDAGPSYSLSVFLGQPGASAGVPEFASTATTKALPYVTQTDGQELSFKPERLSDFDGDGLADVILTREALGAPYTPQERDRAQMVWFSRVSTDGYTLGGSGNEITSFAAMASPALESDETNLEAFSRTADINGDGLEDLVSVKVQPEGVGYWSVRLNTGGRWGPRLITTSRRGIEVCRPTPQPAAPGVTFAWGTCADRWAPMFAPLLTIADTDSDGRAEILAPRAFAMRVCNKQTDWVGGDKGYGEPRDTYWCPENPLTGDKGPNPFDPNTEGFRGFYGSVGGGSSSPASVILVDGSAYFMDAVRFVQTGVASIAGLTVNTPIVKGGATDTGVASAVNQDVYGDGLEDYVAPIGLPVPPDTDGLYPYYHPYVFVDPADPTWGPAALPDGTPASTFDNTWTYFIAENPGASITRNPDGVTPQTPDMLAMVTDGFGVQTAWTYYPLSSKAGRTGTDTPLYYLPGATSTRYVDDRHFYFSSSMPVVADMIQSDGLGDYRAWRYGYSEAMYQARGRGFQGFRTIIEEDEAAGTRTTTTFNQKFPLTGKPARIAVSSLKRAWDNYTGPISKQTFAWLCNRANRADLTACAPPSGTATVKFPFLDMQETWTYDAAIADTPSGAPPQLSYRKQVAADDTTCAGGLVTTSGYDAYGNVTANTVLSYDGDGSAGTNGTSGYREFVGVHCARTRTTFAAADTTNWWLDKVNSRSITTEITYDATNHPLPAGVVNPAQTVATAYTWNTNRTPATETVQSGVTNQQRVTTYVYPASNNYGLPASISVTASGDSNGARTATTTYSADGYFPLVVSNPLAHQVTTVTRPEDGQPSQITDANGLRTLMMYDAFGFNSRIQYRGATDAEYVAPDKTMSLSWFPAATCPTPVPTLRVRAVVVQDGTPTRHTVSDQLGRVVLTATHLADTTWSWQATQYDALGHESAESQPYRTGDALYWMLYPEYDILGRPLQKVIPQPNQDRRGDLVTSYTYVGRQTQIQVCGSADPDTTQCLNMSRTTDSLGRYVEAIDAKNGVTKFWYDGSGNALAIRDAKSNVISATYNTIGQRTAVSDPNQGAWSFGYNALGEVLNQTDARGIVTTTTYDKLSRPKQRSATYDYDGVGVLDSVVDTWTYDPAYGNGRESSNVRKVNTTTLRTEAMTYDTLSRLSSDAVTQLRADNVTATTVTQETAYDAYYGRPKAQSYGNAEAVWLRYSAYGHLTRESDANTSADFRLLNTVDASGNPLQETLAGGNLIAIRSYFPQTGQVASINYGSIGDPSLRKLEYAYDVFGNLGEQALDSSATSETYTYDALQRLTQATRVGAATGTVTYAYDAVGNFTSKSDFSTTAASAYTYTGGGCGGGPNAVKTVTLQAGGSRTYCYDPAGNMTGDNAGLALKYDHTQRPIRIARGAVVQTFDYAPDGMRFRQAGSDGEVAYFGGLERRYSPGANDKTYVGNSAVVTQSGATRTVNYLLTDRLGSVDAVVSASGALIETRGYDAFGKPRTGTWANALPPRLGTTTNTPHGFTGHEHLNQLELIHMHGRVYDYNLGRFTGVDPVIQLPLNSQSLNPYSYIMNNPLAGTDPTGFAAMNISCAGAKWACTQMAIDSTKGRGAPIGFPAILASLGLTSGGGSHDFSVSNQTLRIMDNGAHTRKSTVAVGDIQTIGSASGRSNGENANEAVSGSTTGSRDSSEPDLSENVGGRGIKKDGFVLDSKGQIVNSDEVSGPFVEAGKVVVTDGMAKIRYVKDGVNYYHAGKDFVPLNANGSVRTDAYAISGTGGTILAMRRADGFGDHAVLVRTPNGNQVIYGHMESVAPGLKVGQEVSLGTRLGIIGNEGLPTHLDATRGLHLHVEIRVGDVPFTGKRYGL